MITFTLAVVYFCTTLLIHQTQAAGQPDQVIEFFRHGARGPQATYDPQWSKSELGQLTVTGMVQHYNLGKKIATNYPHLVASGYDPKDIYVLSNYIPRTIESAVVQVSSIFRGTTSTLEGKLPNGLQASLIAQYESSLPASETSRGNYVPVHVNVVASVTDEELIFNAEGLCKTLSSLNEQSSTSTQMKNAWTTFQAPIQKANTYLSESQKITSLRKLFEAYDAFICDVYDGKTLPGGITDTHLIESLNYGQEYYHYVHKRLQTLQKELISWNTLKAITNQLTNFRQGNNAKKLVLLSGHDVNIDAMLAVLNVMNPECLLANYNDHENGRALSHPNCQYPKFASHLIFEFYNDTTNPYVKTYYNDIIVPLCDGQDSCSYGDFIALFEKAGGGIDSVDTWHQKCGNKSGLSTGAIIGIGIGSAVALTIIVVLGRWIHKKQKYCFSKRHSIKPIMKIDKAIPKETETDAERGTPINQEMID